jgi:hypothetical protein
MIQTEQLPLFAFDGDEHFEPLPAGAVFVSPAHRHYDLILPVWAVVEFRQKGLAKGWAA